MTVNSSKSLNEKLQGRLALLHNSEKLKEKLQLIEKDVKQKDELNDEIEGELHLKEEEIQHLQTECEMLRQELAAKTNQITLIHEQMEALRKDLVLAKKERHTLKVKLEEMNANMDEKWGIMMNALENRLHMNRRLPAKQSSSDQKDTVLPSLNNHQAQSLKFVDNRYSITPKDKMKTKLQQTQSASPRHVVSKKTAFIGTKPRSFNKFLK